MSNARLPRLGTWLKAEAAPDRDARTAAYAMPDGARSRFLHHIPRAFVIAQSHEPGVSKVVLPCPFEELDCPTSTGVSHRQSTILAAVSPATRPDRPSSPVDSRTGTLLFPVRGTSSSVPHESWE